MLVEGLMRHIRLFLDESPGSVTIIDHTVVTFSSYQFDRFSGPQHSQIFRWLSSGATEQLSSSLRIASIVATDITKTVPSHFICVPYGMYEPRCIIAEPFRLVFLSSS
mmetsp:Transcript_31867/g.95378  ORF Transcript_31867/g.95378 Transcript_31867/m.95378 type:complete len:108 (-) Transcript_31867:1155-1478(-)